MESKKINQLATELAPELSDLTIIGDPTTGISKKITLSQMASLFTGTVEEYASLSAFPLVGAADTIYIALDTNIIYRWNTGTSAYVELSPNIVTSLVFNDANGFDGTISLVGSTATLTITTALTTGSVGFIGASGALLEDNANFFWNNSTKRLGINTNAPTTTLDVFGSGIIGRVNGTSTNNAFLGFASAGSNKWSIGNVQSDHRFRIYSEANTSELVSVLQTGEFGIGIANPLTKLHIFGGATALIANLDANTSVAKSISYRSGNSSRINLEVSGTESGSNAGANFFLRTYTDAGALIETPFQITRSTGLTTLKNVAITGLTSGYLPKANGSSALSNSLIYDDGTTIAIGTTSTYSGNKFQIAANSVYSSNWDNAQLWITGTDTAKRLQIGYDTTNNYGIIQAIQGGVSVKNLLLNPQGGNVTIGTLTDSFIPNIYITGGVAKSIIRKDSTTTTLNTEAPTLMLYNGGSLTQNQIAKIAFSANSGAAGSSTNGIIGADISAVFVGNNTGNGRSTDLVFSTNNQSLAQETTERLRISSIGNVQVGPSSQAELFSVYGNRGGANLVSFINTSTTGYGISVGISNNSSNTYRYFEGFDNTNTQRIAIYTNGDIKNSNNSYGALSDIKLKENIIDASPKLDKLMQVRVVNYNLKGEELKQIGVIAQELELIFPGLIEECVDTIKDETTGEIIELETKTKSVKYSVFVPMLIKAIQEQQTQIEELKAKIK